MGAKTSADRAALGLAQEEHHRSTSALRPQREELLSASSDTEKEITELKRALEERKLRLTTLQGRQYFTDATLSLAESKY